MANCIICNEQVHLANQAAHLRTKHATPSGGFRFWWDGTLHFTDKPSMLIGDLRRACNSPVHGFVVQEVSDKQVYLSDDEAVDLTMEPHFYILLPATY